MIETNYNQSNKKDKKDNNLFITFMNTIFKEFKKRKVKYSSDSSCFLVRDMDSLGTMMMKRKIRKSLGSDNYTIHTISPYPHPTTHSYTCRTVSFKTGNTSGMICHFMTHHHKEYEAMQAKKPSSDPAKKSGSINRFYPLQQKDHFIGIKEIKKQFKVAVTSWVVQEAVPISVVETPSWHNMSQPLKKSINNDKCKQTYNLERSDDNRKVCIESNRNQHDWTWSGLDCRSSVTSHFINDNRTLESCCLDFKVFTGTTSSDAIYYMDIHNVLNQFQGDLTMFLIQLKSQIPLDNGKQAWPIVTMDGNMATALTIIFIINH